MRIADEAEARFARKVAWGARCGDEEELFTTLSVPVMTRLRLPERQVLDTLVDAGVARSRSHALAWCVRLVGDHEGEWIDQLRDALVHVEKVRSEGPGARVRRVRLYGSIVQSGSPRAVHVARHQRVQTTSS